MPRQSPSSVFLSRVRPLASAAACLLTTWAGAATRTSEMSVQTFQKDIQPLLRAYCYDCHGDGRQKGGVNLDNFRSDQDLLNHDLWLRTLKNVRGGLMPPAGEPRMAEADKEAMMAWIKAKAFSFEPSRPDPGKVTVRRLNRVEYKNTIRDLLGVDFDTHDAFPADDAGHGFDNIADVLTLSPMLLEKYLDAAQTIVTEAVPAHPRVVAEAVTLGRYFERDRTGEETPSESAGSEGKSPKNSLDLSYYKAGKASTAFDVKVAGQYQLVVNVEAVEQYVDNVFDYNKCRLTIRSDGEVLLEKEFVREGYRNYSFTFDRDWAPGAHSLELEITPLTSDQPQPRKLRMRVHTAVLRGPLAPQYWVQPKRYAEFFPGTAPTVRADQPAYARQVLSTFAARAFRRPAEPEVLARLVQLTMLTAEQPDTTFEMAIGQSIAAILASPRFLFREDYIAPAPAGSDYAEIDDYSLASRLSYFLWSSMPDAELLRLASEGELRGKVKEQVTRMLADPRSQEFIRNFTGQWLQARDVTTVPIEALMVHLRDHPNQEVESAMSTFRRLVQVDEAKRTPEEAAAFTEARKVFIGFFRNAAFPQLKPGLREAMQKETEMLFATVLNERRSALELLNANYAHLNEELAKHYEIEGVVGPEMRKVMLPPNSVRGGILTQGTVLTVTSNPTRTSPVKRGVFILDNILGAPPPPPPPNIPPLEEAGTDEELKKLSLRDTLALHAKKPMCHSCHSRMDPLGLALENFNALGRYREKEMSLPIDPAGSLITGEHFADVRELKRVLVSEHRTDFYYCLSEKLMTYALGRSLEYYDTQTLDGLVSTLEKNDGRLDVLISAIVESAPFQKRRAANAPVAHAPLLRQSTPLVNAESKL